MYYNPLDPWLSKAHDSATPLLKQLLPLNASVTSCVAERSDSSNAFSSWNAYLVGRAAGKSLQSWLVLLGYYDVSHSWSQSLILHISQLPDKYRTWWLELLRNDPIHVLIETALLSFLVYLVIMRKKSDWRAKFKDRLSEEETEELLREWRQRGRAPLAPETMRASDVGSPSETRQVTVQSVDGLHMTLHWTDSVSPQTTHTQKVLNFATHDFLGMASQPTATSSLGSDPVKDAARQALTHYGCGSCGPRGFYGTIDAHLDLEHDMAEFTGTHDGIMYSDGAAGCASTVAAFAKRGDLILVDEGVYEALGTGVTLSRANVKYFKHNDMDDLRRVMERVRATDISLGRKSNAQKRFIVVEGLYKNHGTICPLDELVKLKHEFCYRLILDESNSFGVLGRTGRGALEHFGLQYMCDAEIVTISLENSLGSVGGVTVGNEEVVDHQRLSGAGYCFSASSPPFLARAAQASLKLLGTEQGRHRVHELQTNVEYFYQKLELLHPALSNFVTITSTVALSPLIYLKLVVPEDDTKILSREEQCQVWDQVANRCMDEGLLVVSTGRHVGVHLHKKPSPALKVVVMAHHTKEDLDFALRTLEKAMTDVLRY